MCVGRACNLELPWTCSHTRPAEELHLPAPLMRPGWAGDPLRAAWRPSLSLMQSQCPSHIALAAGCHIRVQAGWAAVDGHLPPSALPF